MEVTRDAADDRTPATNGKLAAAPLVMRRTRRVTAAEHPRPQLRGRSLPGNLIGRRGAALAPPILLAVGLSVAGVTGLAGIDVPVADDDLARLQRRGCLAFQVGVAVGGDRERQCPAGQVGLGRTDQAPERSGGRLGGHVHGRAARPERGG
jgi:hypothetical protein